MTEQERIEWQQHMRTATVGSPIIAFDFDDTLTAEGGCEAAQALQRAGFGVVVFTVNADLDGIGRWIVARWPADLPYPAVTDRKPPAELYVDDKAFRFVGDWDAVMEAAAETRP